MAVFSKGLGLKYDGFLLEAVFDPFNWLKNINKHLETCWHIPKHLPGHKDHQNWAFGSDFRTSQAHPSLQCCLKNRYFRQHLRAWVSLRSAKIGFKSPILVLFVSWKVFWDMQTCFQMFVDVFEPIKGVKNGLEQKTSFFSPNPILKTAIS